MVSSPARVGAPIQERAFEAAENGVYPNPVSNKLTIQLGDDAAEKTEVTLRDNMGKLITSAKVKGREHTLDFSAVPQGVYIISLTNSKGSIFRKIVKE